MSDFILSCCSTADLSKEHFQKRDIRYVCFHFEIDGVSYPDDLGESMDFHEFYKKMADGAMTKTSQVNVDEYVTYFEEFLKEGKDILHLCLSTGISGTYNSAMIARDDLQEKYPDRKIYVIDSLAASAGLGLFMDMLADMRDEGKSIDELKEFAEENRLFIHHWFFTTNLTYLVRGGRVTKTAGFVGNLLNICPLLNVNDEGKLIAREKIRTPKKVIRAAVEKMKEHALNGTDYDGKCYISHSDCIDYVDEEVALIEEAFPKLKGKVNVSYIGTTIGSHTGPGTVALFFFGKDKRTP
ncbi:MAG: DegV family protein [Lachnospiraceae bacterium]|nr:DegV family protein [Lachnospiraceae bacterium]